MSSQEIYEALCCDFFPLFKQIPATEKYAITLGGSHGKGIADTHSDYDFRIYFEQSVPSEQLHKIFDQIMLLVNQWKQRGVEVDGIWPRLVSDVDSALELWLSGNGSPKAMEWTVWGYHILTDIYNQQILEDPYAIASNWKKLLTPYPLTIKQAIIKKHESSLRYWLGDYHYSNKFARADLTFLAYITTRLIYDIMQVIYALNEFYYPGDGMNLLYADKFILKPNDFVNRVECILYPGKGGHIEQYKQLRLLIEETLALTDDGKQNLLVQ